MRRNNKVTYLGFVIMILLIGIGYALLTTNLNITGTTVLKDNRWDIHFENVQVTSGSVTATTPAIDQAGTTVSYGVTLDKPGDFYEFTVNAVNDGSIDGMIESFSSKLNGAEITTLPNALEYSVTYSDAVPIANKHLLATGSSETFRIKVEYKTNIEISDLPSTEQTLNLLFTITYVQADDTAFARPASLFEMNEWSKIINDVQFGNTEYYYVGDTKQIELGNSLGTHRIRIANKSTPSECEGEGFSQTGCGFVLEFEDIIIGHAMNTSNVNTGGWPSCDMRTYLNDINDSTSFINSLPDVLKNAIINTFVVSSHGARNSANFTSTDKIYLLSAHEVFVDADGNPSAGLDHYDTAYFSSRQLDYYVGLNITTSNYADTIKKKNGTNSSWWLRDANSPNSDYFYYVTPEGKCSGFNAASLTGVSPSFRLGGLG